MKNKNPIILGVCLIVVSIVFFIFFIYHYVIKDNENPKLINNENSTEVYEKSDYDEILNPSITISGLSEEDLRLIENKINELNTIILEYVQYNFAEKVSNATLINEIINDTKEKKYILQFQLNDSTATKLTVDFYYDTKEFQIN